MCSHRATLVNALKDLQVEESMIYVTVTEDPDHHQDFFEVDDL